MMWQRLLVEVDSTWAEALADALLHSGALAVGIEQHPGAATQHALFGEPGANPNPLWERCQLDAWLSPDQDPRQQILAAMAEVALVQEPAWQVDWIADQDWVGLTQNQFQPIAITDRMWIVPTWHDPPDPRAINIRLDPGQAFGTGSHPSTQLCLRWLCDLQPLPEQLLDYGCGSGILAIAAHLLGVPRVTGVDIDPVAVATANDNARRNRSSLELLGCDQLAPQRRFAAVVANILATPLILLAPVLMSHLKPGGRIALAGVLHRQSASVQAAYALHGCDIEVCAEQDEWVCLSGVANFSPGCAELHGGEA